MNIKPWTYSEDDQRFIKPSSFSAWIAGTDDANHSASAWLIEHRENIMLPICETRQSDGPSTANRGVLSAIVRCCEALAPKSSVQVYTNSTYVRDAVESLEIWRDNGWRGTSGKIANVDLLERLFQASVSRGVDVEVVHASKGTSHAKRIERLKGLAIFPGERNGLHPAVSSIESEIEIKLRGQRPIWHGAAENLYDYILPNGQELGRATKADLMWCVQHSEKVVDLVNFTLKGREDVLARMNSEKDGNG